MSRDNHANYTKIGIAIMLGTIAIVLTLIHIGGINSRGNELLMETYYDLPVTGLSVGSPVNFRGVQIGEVREIAFVGTKYDVDDKNDYARIYILMAVSPSKIGYKYGNDDFEQDFRRMIVEFGYRASVAPTGITGMSRIECDVRHEGSQQMRPFKWKPKHLVMPSELSLMDNFSVAATKVMNQINQMDINAAWSNIYRTVESLAIVSHSLRSSVEMHRPDVDRIFSHVESASISAEALTEKLQRNPAVLLRGNEEAPLPETTP